MLHTFFRSGTSEGHIICTWYLFLSCSSCCVSSAIWSSWSSISGCFSQFETLRQPPASSSTSSTCSWCRGTLANPFSQDRLDSKNPMCSHLHAKRNGSSLCFFLFTFLISHRLGFKCFWWLWPCSLCLCYYWATLSTSIGNTRAETAWACTGWGFSFCVCFLQLWPEACWLIFSLSPSVGVSACTTEQWGGALSHASSWYGGRQQLGQPLLQLRQPIRGGETFRTSSVHCLVWINNFPYDPNSFLSSTAWFYRSVPQSIHSHYRVLSGLHL